MAVVELSMENPADIEAKKRVKEMQYYGSHMLLLILISRN